MELKAIRTDKNVINHPKMHQMVGKVISEGRQSTEAPEISSYGTKLVKKDFLKEVAFELSLE